MGLFNISKKLSLTLIGLSYLSTAHAADIGAIVSGVINTATTDATDIIKKAKDAIKIDGNDCGMPFPQSGKVFVLVENMECSDVQGDFALQFSGDHNFVFLNDHSITAVDGLEPGRGIFITGNENHVIGSGTVEGFGADESSDANIVIENAVGNHVSKLALNKGVNGVLIKALDDGSAQANHIYHNHVQDGNVGIIVSSVNNSSADANQIYDNHIKDVSDAIFISSDISSSSDRNQIISNHIIRPGGFAIGLSSQPADNLIDNNFTKDPQDTLVYCDNAGDGGNDWGTNFIDMVAQIGFPGTCS